MRSGSASAAAPRGAAQTARAARVQRAARDVDPAAAARALLRCGLDGRHLDHGAHRGAPAHIGYTPTITVLSVPVTFASLKNKDIDVFLGNWMPAQEADRAPYDADGSITVVGPNLFGAKYTLAVPAYFYAQGLKDFSDIHRFADAAQPFDLRHRARQRRQPAGAQDAEGQPVRPGRFQADRIERTGHARASRACLPQQGADRVPGMGAASHEHALRHQVPERRRCRVRRELWRRHRLHRHAQGLRRECPNVGRLLDNLKFTCAARAK
jgi:hypothetical protein